MGLFTIFFVLFFSNALAKNTTLLQELESAVDAYRANTAALRLPDIESALVSLAKQSAKEGKTHCQLNVKPIVGGDATIAEIATNAFIEHWQRYETNVQIIAQDETFLRLCWSLDTSCQPSFWLHDLKIDNRIFGPKSILC